jgi:hypothetical protein
VSGHLDSINAGLLGDSRQRLWVLSPSILLSDISAPASIFVKADHKRMLIASLAQQDGRHDAHKDRR